MRKKLLIGAIALLAAAGGAFFAAGGSDWLDAMGLRGQERLVESRMRGYWNARLAHDPEKMTEYLHPEWGRVSNPGLLNTESYEIKEIKLLGDDRAAAAVAVKSRVNHPLVADYVMDTTVVDKWMRVDGQWYREPGPRTLAEKIRAVQGQFKAPWEEEATHNDESVAQ